MSDRALLLNSTYEPLRVISWKRAFTLYFTGKIEILHEYDAEIHTVNQSFKIPAVVRLYEYARIRKYNNKVKFSKANVFQRDKCTCAYCGNVFPKQQLTIDHVVPVSHGGLKTWENVVTACQTCNAKKGNRNPIKAGMPLKYKPKKPTSSYSTYWIPLMQNIPECWTIYLAHILPS